MKWQRSSRYVIVAVTVLIILFAVIAGHVGSGGAHHHALHPAAYAHLTTRGRGG